MFNVCLRFEVADLLKIPDSFGDKQRQEMAMEWIKEKGFNERPREVKAWADKGIKQFEIVFQELREKFDSTSHGHECQQNALASNRMLQALVDGEQLVCLFVFVVCLCDCLFCFGLCFICFGRSC